MRVAVIQFSPGIDGAANRAAVERLVDAAVARHAPALVGLPEMWSCLGGNRDEKLAASEPLPAPDGRYGPLGDFLRGLARRHGIVMHGGSIGEREGDRLYNTSLVFGPDGREVGRYRKIHLFDVTTPDGAGYHESRLFGAGASVVTADLGAVRLGLSICYDLRFPELYLALRRAGASLLAIPSAFTVETGRDHWDVLMRARAIETQCPVLASATCGTHRDAAGHARETWGHAMITDGWGRVLASLDREPGYCAATFDLASLDRLRTAMPVLAHRRLV